MGVGFVGMDSNAGPDVIVALGDANDVIPLALAGGDVEESGNASFPCIIKYFVLAFGEALVIEMAMAVDQPHAAASGSSSSSSRGKSGCGSAIGAPPAPASICVSSLSADRGMIGAIARANSRTATTSVPSTAAIRSGSVLRSAQGACVST